MASASRSMCVRPICIARAGMLVALVALPARAQWPVSDTLPGILRTGRNPAGVGRTGPRDVPRVHLFVEQTSGAYRLPQQPERSSGGGLRAEGLQRFGGWTADGQFSYTRRLDQRVRWANVADATSGSPYVWADSLGGDWRRDDVTLRGSLGTPEWHDRIALGTRIDYAIGQGARRNDPRPLYRRRGIEVVQGLSLRLSGSHRIGLAATLGWDREDDELGNFASSFPVIYRLRGHGTYDRTQLTTADRATLGRRYGGSAQYEGMSGLWSWSAAIGVHVLRNSVRDGIATPTFGGSFARTSLDVAMAMRRVRAAGGLDLAVGGTVQRGDGTDPVFRAVNVIDDDQWGSVRLLAWRGASSVEPSHFAVASVGLARSRRRDIVAETHWSTVVPTATLGVGVQQPLAHGFRLLGFVEVRSATGVDRSYEALRPTELTPVLVRPAYDVHGTTRRGGSLSLGLALPSAPGQRRSRVMLDLDTWRATGRFERGDPLGDRTTVRLTYSLQ